MIEEVCSDYSVTLSQLFGSGRIRAVSDARSFLAVRMAEEYGLSRKEIARRLNVSHTAVAKMLDRNRAKAG
ncbi:MAG: helix-turn-helix domain-containing protein [Thermoleophilia bacterium]